MINYGRIYRTYWCSVALLAVSVNHGIGIIVLLIFWGAIELGWGGGDPMKR